MIDKMIKSNIDCMGCHACDNICPVQCIEMTSDSEGFLYPKVDYNRCIQCKKCISVCPIINKNNIDNTPQSYACVNKDLEIRLSSSSGGVFTLLAETIIKEKGVVFGAGYNNEFEVIHKFVDNIEDLSELRGSKYVQSKIGNSYSQTKELLNNGKKVLFSGTPCQIAGLKSYLNKPYENLVTQDFICHGVPSPKVWRRYIEFCERNARSKVSSISFRNKSEGWKKFSVALEFKNKKKYSKNLKEDPYLRAFLQDVCLRPSCYECQFKGLSRPSDFTLADFWGVEHILPELDDDKGTSLVMVNSDHGKNIFDAIKDKLDHQEVDLNEVIKFNSAAIKSSIYNPKRESFLKELDSVPFDKLVKRHFDDSFIIKVNRRVNNYLNRIKDKTKLL